jgi:transcriptional regulator with XRE-family HTH domain
VLFTLEINKTTEQVMKKIGETIGKNIKTIRDQFGFTQEHVAGFLGLKDRSLLSLYESGDREIPLVYLSKLADLYGVEVEDFMVDNLELKSAMAVAFRKDGLDEKDLKAIAEFQKVVKNYITMKKLDHEQK